MLYYQIDYRLRVLEGLREGLIVPCSMNDSKSVVICNAESVDARTGMWRFHCEISTEASDVNISYSFDT